MTTTSTRPPNQPPTPPPPPPPPGPKPPTPAADDWFALAETLGFPAPARRDPMDTRSQESAAVATPGGPVKTTCFAAGEELTPSSAVALSGATRESGESCGRRLVAGANVHGWREEPVEGDGRAGGASGAATFSLPLPLMGFALRPPMPGSPPPLPPQPSPLPMPPPPPPLA